MLPNDFMNDKRQELFGKVRIKVADRREMPHAACLLRFSTGIARAQPVLRLQLADSPGTSEPLRQHVDNRGVDIVDAVSEVSKSGSGIVSVCHHNLPSAGEKPVRMTRDEPLVRRRE
jgi:hypothetical protein